MIRVNVIIVALLVSAAVGMRHNNDPKTDSAAADWAEWLRRHDRENPPSRGRLGGGVGLAGGVLGSPDAPGIGEQGGTVLSINAGGMMITATHVPCQKSAIPDREAMGNDPRRSTKRSRDSLIVTPRTKHKRRYNKLRQRRLRAEDLLVAQRRMAAVAVPIKDESEPEGSEPEGLALEDYEGVQDVDALLGSDLDPGHMSMLEPEHGHQPSSQASNLNVGAEGEEAGGHDDGSQDSIRTQTSDSRDYGDQALDS
jgi:hypothetical protein